MNKYKMETTEKRNPHPDTVAKVLAFLIQLKEHYSLPRAGSLVGVLQFNNLAGDYGKIIIENGVLIKETVNLRGPTKYRWNNQHTPTNELAIELIQQFSSLRKAETNNLKISGSKKSDKILALLYKICDKVGVEYEN